MGAALMTCFLTCSRGPAAAPHAAGGPLLHHMQQVISLGLRVLPVHEKGSWRAVSWRIGVGDHEKWS